MIQKSFFVFLFVIHYGGATYNELNDAATIFGLDDYNSCLRPNDGIYCVVSLHLQAGTNAKLFHNIQDYSTVKQHFNHSFIDRGVCVTKKCKQYVNNKTADVEWILGACLNDSIHSEYGLEAKVAHFFCDRSNEETVIDTSDWVVAACVGFVVLINVIGSLYHYYFQEHDAWPGHSILLCFSLFKNWKWLTFKSKHPQLASLQGLHGIRTIAIIVMILSHIFIMYCAYIDNEYYLEEIFPSYWIVTNGGMMIQLFFMMTGMLLAFKMQLAAEKAPIPWSVVPKIIIFRWLRLTPPYALMLAFSATWMRHVGSGPLWKSAVAESTSADCRQYWWHHILYFNNYAGEVGKYCAAQTWYVPADMQLFVIGVIVLVGTQTRGRVLALALLAAVGVVAPGLHVWKDGLDGAVLFTPEAYRGLNNMKTFYHLHVLGHNNVSAFALGMAAAVFLYRRQKAGIHIKKYKKRFSFGVPILALPILVIYCGCVLFLDNAQPVWVRMAYQGLHRLIFTAIASVVEYYWLKDETISKVLEWDGWIVPSRLCYSAYIVHMLFINYFLGIKTQLTHFSLFNWMSSHIIVTCLSFMTALPLCLAVEAPMLAIIDRMKRGEGERPIHGNGKKGLNEENYVNGNTKVVDKEHYSNGNTKVLDKQHCANGNTKVFNKED